MTSDNFKHVLISNQIITHVFISIENVSKITLTLLFSTKSTSYRSQIKLN
jgi:hypothetical protein